MDAKTGQELGCSKARGRNGSEQTCFCSWPCKRLAAVLDAPPLASQLGAEAAGPRACLAVRQGTDLQPPLLTPLSAPSLPPSLPLFPVAVKTGNNGGVSCDTFCRGAQWGGIAYRGCGAAYDQDGARDIACDKTRGRTGPKGMVCYCHAT